MRNAGLSILLFLVLALCARAPVAQAEPLASHLVLISIDGLRPEFYLEETWPTPMLQQMRWEGAHAKAVRPVFPSVTYPSHTTLVTGALPARHGVYYNRPFDPEGDSERWYWEASHIKVPTLWDAVVDRGGKSASISWPVTVGADIYWNVPEVWSLDAKKDPLDPMRRLSTPPGLWRELEQEATGRLNMERFGHTEISRDDLTGAMAAYLFKTKRPTLLAVHLIATDIFQHEHGREGLLTRRALAAADRAVSRVVEAVEQSGMLDRTAIFVTGDHGFVDLHTRISPNVWLVEEGLRAQDASRGPWKATFHVNGSVATLHLKDPGDLATRQRVEKIFARLSPGIRGLFRVVSAKELQSLGAAPDAELALAPAAGVTFSSETTGPALVPATGATHGHHPEIREIQTGFLAWGAGIRAGAVAHQMRLEDVAPLASHLLGLDLGPQDGAALLGLLEGDSSHH